MLFQSYIQDASRRSLVMQLSSPPISGYFASYRLQQKPRHDSGRAKPPPRTRRATLEPLPKQKNSNKAGLRPFLYTSVLQLQPMKNRAFHTPLLYIIPFLPHPVSADNFRIRYRGKMVFSILAHVHELL